MNSIICKLDFYSSLDIKIKDYPKVVENMLRVSTSAYCDLRKHKMEMLKVMAKLFKTDNFMCLSEVSAYSKLV